MIWKMAWRNVWRNKRRTLITATSLAIGVAVMSMFYGLAGGMLDRMVRNVTDTRLGEAQIHASEYRNTQDETLLIPDSDELLADARALPAVKVAAPRALGMGIVAIGDRSRGVALIGIDPEHERGATNWDERIVEGEYIDGPGQVMIGKYMAEKLEVELGSKLILTVADVQTGEAMTELLRVKAIVATGDVAVDRQSAIIEIGMAQEMMGTTAGVHEIALRLNVPPEERAPIDDAIAPLKRDGVEVASWHEINVMVSQLQEIMAAYTAIMTFVLFMIISFGVVNTISMSLLERTREFGVMRALGTSARELSGLIVAEAILLGLVGAFPGVVVGLLLSQLIATYGIDFGGTTAYGMEFADKIYGEVHVLSTIQGALIFTALTALVSLITALRAARLDPVEAMRG